LKKYQVGLGLIISVFLAVAMLPIRLTEGQGKDPVNLIGSEIVICCLWLSCWLGTHVIQHKTQVRNWQKIVLSILLCIVLSIVFYHASNPFFEDYPLAPIRKNSFWVGIVRLSIRGAFISFILVPFIFYIDHERRVQKEKLEIEKRHARDLQQRNHLLEQTVAERTVDLEKMLSDLNISQKELDNQIYLQSRLLASITHDIQGPFNYVLLVSKNINRLINERKFEQLPEYTQGLEASLESMLGFMSSLLEFTKTQIKNEAVHLTWVSLPEMIIEKAVLFEGIIKSKNNMFHHDINEDIEVHTNRNLFAIVLHNLLDNATKYTGNGSIHAYMDRVDHEEFLVIENSADSIPRNMIDWINNQYSVNQSNAAPDQTVGIGLILVHQIAALLNIKFFVRTQSGRTMACLGLVTRRASQYNNVPMPFNTKL
jgi:signal transduction histidine kinase